MQRSYIREQAKISQHILSHLLPLTVNQRDLQGHQIELLAYTVYVRYFNYAALMITVKVKYKKTTL